MGNGVGIVEIPWPVVDDFHAGIYAPIAVNIPGAHLNPHDGQIGRGELHSSVVRREISPLTLASQQHEHQHHYENQSLHLNYYIKRTVPILP
jgi:hypothetical protein